MNRTNVEIIENKKKFATLQNINGRPLCKLVDENLVKIPKIQKPEKLE